MNLPNELAAAIRIVTSLTLFAGFFAWVRWLVGRGSLKRHTAEHVVLQGAGIGVSAGLALAVVSFAA